MRFLQYAEEKLSDARKTKTLVESDLFFAASEQSSFNHFTVSNLIAKSYVEQLREYCETILLGVAQYKHVRTETLRRFARRRKIFGYQSMGKFDLRLSLEEYDAERSRTHVRDGNKSVK